ncbi:TlpA family protein disulfide reductase [Oceanospirillum sediminis]|uniref:TlpA family protein disulfide reductase n=1 Tax=Oceanospirillum sediminis TaxID=2760088 RepID=A0A839ITP0_9GAMM|nr:TlpA disulfide reductase family protein [Oceanospirillum sediminis]MBB1488022.1 TlpA family protein disulfide reductase [Oceanospirillum sediminis]
MKYPMLKTLQYLACGALLSGFAIQAQAGQTTRVGDPAPVFSSQTITGQHFNLADYTGKKPVYLKFWATWCSYCKAEMPHLNSIKQQYGDDIEIVTINVGMNDSVAKINHFFQNQGYSLPVIFDHKGELTARYQVIGTPHHILIDKEGRIAYRTFLATDQLDQMIMHWSQLNSSAASVRMSDKPKDIMALPPVYPVKALAGDVL